MTTFNNFEDIGAWQEARVLSREVYAITRDSSFSKDFALRDQIRRAVISIAANIAEGFERNGTTEFLQFLSIAKGSAGEVRALLYLALDQEYVTKPHFDELHKTLVKISRMIEGLMKYLRASKMKGPKYKKLD